MKKYLALIAVFLFSCSGEIESPDSILQRLSASSSVPSTSSGGDDCLDGDGCLNTGSSSSDDSNDGGDGNISSSSGGGSNSSSSGSNVGSQCPSSEPMSTKTALQYFRDEGITIGINVGNSLDAVANSVAEETAWGNPRVNQAYISGLKTSGFKIIRIPVTYIGHIGSAPNYKVEETYLMRVAEVVNMAKTAGLKAIINIHHDGHQGHEGSWLDIDRADTDPTITQKYVKVWTQIAEYFKTYGDWLMFQGFNEIHKDGNWNGNGTQAQYNIINDWNQKFTTAVRGTGCNNANRYLLYYGYMISPTIATTDYTKFKLPTDPATKKQVVGFHYYNPIDFSLETKTHIWDTPGARSEIANFFSAFKTKFINNGIPVIIGENGPAAYANYSGNSGYSSANVATAHQNRLSFIDYMYGKAKENELVPIYWENGTYDAAYAAEGDFSLFNRNNGQPNSEKSREVIERMIAAINNPSGGGGDDGGSTRCKDNSGNDYFCKWTDPILSCWAIDPAHDPDSRTCPVMVNECKLWGQLYINSTVEGAGVTCNGSVVN
jgi:endoglucanase